MDVERVIESRDFENYTIYLREGDYPSNPDFVGGHKGNPFIHIDLKKDYEIPSIILAVDNVSQFFNENRWDASELIENGCELCGIWDEDVDIMTFGMYNLSTHRECITELQKNLRQFYKDHSDTIVSHDI